MGGTASMTEARRLVVPSEHAGKRIDFFLALTGSPYSRMQWRRLVQEGKVRVDGGPVKPSFRVRAGQVVEVEPVALPVEGPVPEEVPLSILYEDEHIVAVDKPPGMVVHPARGHWSGTLTNALAHHFDQLSSVGGSHRPGIVHRLDRDTSGVILVAKTNPAHYALAEIFQERRVRKEYLAIVAGTPDRDADRITQPIGPHPYQREKMAIRRAHPRAREAETCYEVRESFGRFALVRLLPKTGRTHQIRLHMAHIGCPVLCDRLYGGRSRVTRGALLGTEDPTVVLDRQALHAWRLVLPHPITGASLEITAPVPADFERVLSLLRGGGGRDASSGSGTGAPRESDT